MLTRDELVAVMPKAAGVADQVTPALVAAMQRFEIEAPARRAAFLAQLAHESGQLRHWAENLNYGWQGLRKVFSKYFRTDADARAFDRQPERIANRVYGGRMGNGDEASGDGWRYRGRGPIQLTGKDNYRACGAAIGVDLVGEPARLESPDVGFLAAGWFWAKKGLNDLADAGDFEEITRRINGGLNGLADRAEFWEHAKAVFGVTQPSVVIPRALLERLKPKRKARPKPKPKRKPAGVRTAVARKKPAKAAKPRVPAKKKAGKRRSPAGKRSKVKKPVRSVVRRRSRSR
jgi:putative chitinase